MDPSGPLDQREPRRLAEKMSDAGLNAGGTIPMNRLPFGRPIQPPLQFRKELRGLRFFAGRDQGQQLFLCATGGIQKTPVHFPATQGGAGLFGGRCGVGHKRKQCPKGGEDVNP